VVGSLIPEVPTVRCPVCNRRIALTGLYGEVVPWHRRDPTRQPPCPGQGAVVRQTPAGLVATMPETGRSEGAEGG
jgi:hypothetical protein